MKWKDLENLFNVTIPMANTNSTYKELLSNILKNAFNNLKEKLEESEYDAFKISFNVNVGREYWSILENGDVEQIYTLANGKNTEVRNITSNLLTQIKANLNEEERNILNEGLDQFVEDANKINTSEPFVTTKQDFINKLENSSKQFFEYEKNAKELAKTNPKEASQLMLKSADLRCINGYYAGKIYKFAEEQGVLKKMDYKYDSRSIAETLEFLKNPECDIEIPLDFFENEAENAYNSKYLSPVQDEVDALKSSHPEYSKDLDEINKVLMANTPLYTSQAQNAVDAMEQASDKYTSKTPIEDFLKENKKYEPLFKETSSFMEYVPKINPADAKELKDQSSFDLSPKTKTTLIKLIGKMEEYNIIDTTGKFTGEDQYKVYAFNHLLGKADDVKKALAEGNLEKAKAETESYKELKNKYTELMDICEKELGNKGLNMPGNVSTTRNPAIPDDLNARIEANAQLNGLYQFVNYTKQKGIDPVDFINNPHKHMEKILHSYNENIENKFNNRYLTQGYKLAHLIYDDQYQLSYMEGRAIEFLVKSESDPEQVKKNSIYQAMFNGTQMLVAKNGTFGAAFFGKEKGNDIDFDLLKSYVAAGDKYPISEFMQPMFNTKTMGNYESHFDYQKFLKENNQPTNEIVDKLTKNLYVALKESIPLEKDEDFSKHDNKRFSSLVLATQSYLSDLIKERDIDLNAPENASTRKLLENPFGVLEKMIEDKGENVEYLLNEDYRLLKERYHITSFDALEQTKGVMESYYKHVDNQESSTLREEYEKRFQNQNLDTKELSRLVMLGFKLQDRYDRRTIFGKIFRPSAYTERNALAKIKADLNKYGLSNEEINNIFNSADLEDALIAADDVISNKLVRDKEALAAEQPEAAVQNEQNAEPIVGIDIKFEDPEVGKFLNDCVSYSNRVNDLKGHRYYDNADLIRTCETKEYALNIGLDNFISNICNQFEGDELDEVIEDIVGYEKIEQYHFDVAKANASTLLSILHQNGNNKLHDEAYKLCGNELNHDKLVNNVEYIKGKLTPEELKEYEKHLSTNKGTSLRHAFNYLTKPADIQEFAKRINAVYRPEFSKGVINLADIKDPLHKTEEYDVHYKEKEIEELKTLDNPQLNPILDECNKILTSSTQDLTKFASNQAEHVGALSEKLVNEQIFKAMQKGEDTKGIFEMERTNFNPKKGQAETNAAAAKKFCSEVGEFDAETKAQLKDIVKDLIDSKIFDKDSFSAEQGTKIYSFYKITKCEKDLAKAVDTKDPEKIQEAYKNYKDYEAKYDKILDKIHKFNSSDFIVSNISSAREQTVPGKYRNNYVDASKLSGIWIYVGMCNEAKVDPYEAIDKPGETFKKVYDKLLNHTEIDKYLKTNSITDCIKALEHPSGGALTEAIKKDAATSSGLDRGAKGLLYLSDVGKNFNVYKNSIAFQSIYISNLAESRMLYGTFAFNKENIKNMLTVEPNDRLTYKLSQDCTKFIDTDTCELMKPFDRNNYLKENKTSISRITNRLCELSEGIKGSIYQEKYQPIIKEYATELLKDKTIEKPYACAHLLNQLADGKGEKLNEIDRKALVYEVENEKIENTALELDIPEDIKPVEFDKNDLVDKTENEELEIEVNGKKMDLEEDLIHEIVE